MNPARSNIILAAILSTVITPAINPAFAGDYCTTNIATIPDNATPGVQIPITVTAGTNQTIDSIELDLTLLHDWVGDLVITLESPSGTVITLLDRPGIPSTGFPGPFGCGGRNMTATFTDSAAVTAESTCSTTAAPVIAGPVIPTMPMDTFTDEPADGQWTLTIADHSPYDTGVITDACLSLTTSTACTADLNNDGELDFLDISEFLSAYSASNPLADLNNDGQYDFLDISEFLTAYTTGCP